MLLHQEHVPHCRPLRQQSMNPSGGDAGSQNQLNPNLCVWLLPCLQSAKEESLVTTNWEHTCYSVVTVKEGTLVSSGRSQAVGFFFL